MKKACAVLLCFAMVVCLLPSAVFAIGRPSGHADGTGKPAPVLAARPAATVMDAAAATAKAAAAAEPPAASKRSGSRPTGLKTPVEREEKQFKKTAKTAAKVLPNQDGLARINESRKQNGLQPFSASLAVADGEAVVTSTAPSDLTQQKYASILNSFELLQSALPAAVDLSASKHFPAIGDQGEIGSCASFATTYYAATYETARKRNIDLSAVPGRVLSPRFAYNLNNNGADNGSSLFGNLLTLYTRGAPFADEASMAGFQYNGYDYMAPGVMNPLQYRAYPQTAAIYNDALKNRIADLGIVPEANTEEGLAMVRQMINNGHVLVFGTGYMFDWKLDKRTGNDPATAADDAFVDQGACYGMAVANPDLTSMHAMTVVGYNDDLWVDIDGDQTVDAFEKGALKIANSWGVQWMNGGYIWISYNALREVDGNPGVVLDNALLYIVAQDEYVPKATAEITLSTARRDEITLLTGVNWNEAAEPMYAYGDYVFSEHWGGPYSFAGTTVYSPATVVVDLTDAIDMEGFGTVPGILSLCAGVIDDTSNTYDQRIERVIYRTGGRETSSVTSVPRSVNYGLRWFCGKDSLNAGRAPAYDAGIELLPPMMQYTTHQVYSSGPDDAAEWVFTPNQSGIYTFRNSLSGRENGLEILNSARKLLFAGDTSLRAALYAGKPYIMRAYSGLPGPGIAFTAEIASFEPWPVTTRSARLGALAVTGGAALSPAFVPNTRDYQVVVDDGFTLTATPEDKDAFVLIGGRPGNSLDVPMGEDTSLWTRIEVTSADWLQTQVYRVLASRGTPSANAGLSTLTLDAGQMKPALAAGVDEYFVELGDEQASVTLQAGTAEPGAAIAIASGAIGGSDTFGSLNGGGGISSGTGQMSLTLPIEKGESAIVAVRVTAPDQVATRTYRIHLSRPRRFTPGMFRISAGGIEPSDTFLSQDASTLFLLNRTARKLVTANLVTGVQRSLTFADEPVRMAFSNGEMLVALQTPDTSSDRIAIVDPSDLTIKRQLSFKHNNIRCLAADNDFIYAFSDSCLGVVDRNSGAHLSTLYESFPIDLAVSPDTGRLYSLQESFVKSYSMIDGQLQSHGQFRWTGSGKRLTMMPDGRSMMIGDGSVLACGTDADSDLKPVAKLDSSAPVCVDAALNELYVVDQRRITVYDASSIAFKRVVCEPSSLSYLLSADGCLIVAGKDSGGNLDFRPVRTGALLASLTVNGDAFSEFYPTRLAVDRGEVANAVSQIEIVATPAFPGAQVSGDIGIRPLVVGENMFAIRVSDPFSQQSETYTLRVARRASDPEPTVRNGLVSLGFVPLDMALDPERPVAYLTAKSDTARNDKSLFRVDLKTGAVQEKRFDLPAERLTVRNGKVYVTLLRAPHAYYLGNNGFGAVAVVDTATFRTERIVQTTIDPYDVEADDNGNIYLTPGSNQHAQMHIYDSRTGQATATNGHLYYGHLLDRNPVSGKLYAISTTTSPRDITAFEVKDGRFVTYYDSPYHGDYAMTTVQKISPDGALIFNGSGNLFACAPTKSGDMLFMGRLPGPFGAICFDQPHDRFYTTESSNTVLRAYSYSAPLSLWTVDLPVSVLSLHHDGKSVVYASADRIGTFAPDTLLSGLSVGGSPVAGFKPLTKTHSVTLFTDQETIPITATTLEFAGTVSGDIGTQPLKPGDNTYRIRVTGANSGETAEYTLNVRRFATDNADLTGITSTQGGLSPAFSRTVMDYMVTLPRATASTIITATKDDVGATMTINGASVTSLYVSLAVGETKLVEIAVTARNGITKKVYTVRVTRETIRLTGIGLDRTAAQLKIGDSQALKVLYEPADADNKAVAWASSANDVATVNQSGIVTALKEGEAVITATAVDGGHTASCAVTVVDPRKQDPVYAFVTRFYTLFFNRAPEQGGIDYWSNALHDKTKTGAEVAAYFVDSPEFRALNVNDSTYLDMMYRAFFNREPEAAGKAYWQGHLDRGISRFWVLWNFVNSYEFERICVEYGIVRGVLNLTRPADLYPKISAFVTRFYQHTLERSPDADGLDYWVQDLVDKKRTGAILANDFIFSQEFVARNTSVEQYVTIMYRAFFGREPEPGGFAYWVGELQGGRQTRRDVLARFVYSIEFQGICNDYGIVRGTLP